MFFHILVFVEIIYKLFELIGGHLNKWNLFKVIIKILLGVIDFVGNNDYFRKE